MDLGFCRYYRGDGHPPSNRFCRRCPHASIACDALWQRIRDLASSNGGEPLRLPGTRATLAPHPGNPDFVRLQVNVRWNLPKEDFLHYIATAHAGMGRKGQRDDPRASPSMTRQTPYVGVIVNLIGGWECEEVVRVRSVQHP